MKPLSLTILVFSVASLAGIGGYLLRDRLGMSERTPTAAPVPAPSGPVVYYQHPDGKPAYAGEPAATSDGRPFRAVRASEDVSFDPQAAAKPAEADGRRRILYYRNPMGLPDVSPTPKKDSMGMDYIAVYEGDEGDGTEIRLSPGRIQRTGVVSEKAERRAVSDIVRAPGTVQLDERRIALITVRAESFIEAVEDVTTGTEVRKGQPLMRIYSPAIASAAAEYAAILGGPRGARQKLLNLGVPEDFIAQVERGRQVPLTLTWTAPRDGIVLERNALEGMRANAGDVLFRIADHSVVWAMVDVPEARIAQLAPGQPVAVRVRSFPGRTFAGRVAVVYPHLNAGTRTVRVRIELPNADLVLRPDMYLLAEIETGSPTPAIAVPEAAVIDTGDRQIVILDKGDGRFEPRPVRLGRRGGGYAEVVDGIGEGDAVVTSATFLIDAESNLKAALKSIAGSGPQQ